MAPGRRDRSSCCSTGFGCRADGCDGSLYLERTSSYQQVIAMSVEIRAVVITASDACASGHRADESGETLVRLLGESNAVVVEKLILSDDLEPMVDALVKFSDRDDVNLIVTTGGTGLGPRDNTPEATLRVIE